MQLDSVIVTKLNSFTGSHLWADNLVVFCAEYLPWLVLTAFLVWIGHSHTIKEQRLRVFFSGVIATIVARFGVMELIRIFYERPRPFLSHELNPLFTINEWSFPSGHAAVFSAVAMTVFLHDRRWGIRFFVVTGIIVLARIISGVHYLTDIVAGLILGTFVAWVIYRIDNRLFVPKRRRR